MLEALKKIHFACTHNLSAEGAKAGGKKRKRSTILPIFMVQFFVCVLFFSLCSNLSIWPGGQVVPDGSRCYIPIFDGFVLLFLPKCPRHSGLETITELGFFSSYMVVYPLSTSMVLLSWSSSLPVLLLC